MLLIGNATHLGFLQITYRKKGIFQLLLRELAQEIALVLVLIGTRQQAIDRLTISRLLLRLTAIVPRSDIIGTHLECLLKKDIELYLSVAQHIGVGRAALLILRKHIIDHAAAILLREVHKTKRDIQSFGNQLCKNLVIIPRTVTLQRTRRIVPITHKKAYNIVALLLEQICRHRRVHSTR